ncbi:MAG: MerR family transcriptional regulator [Paludibacteraceae bacterium]
MAQEKLYYSISEVAEMFGINQSNLRFWEKEFKQLKPRRNDKGTRFYTKDDLRVIKQIIFLINDQKLTLEGVRRKLSEKKDVVVKQQELAERLKNIRNELKRLIAQIGNSDSENTD